MNRLLYILFILALVAFNGLADDTTRPGRLELIPGVFDSTRPAPAVPDTIALEPGEITVAGYDKPLRATREAMFVTNHMGATVSYLELEITYTDMQGRELHRRTSRLHPGLPAGATRRIDIPAWDTQQSFYYHLGAIPRRDRATPYRVTVEPRRAVLQP